MKKNLNQKIIKNLKILNKKYFLNKIFIFGDKKIFGEVGFSGKIFSDEKDLNGNFFNGIFIFENENNSNEFYEKFWPKLSYEGILVFLKKNGAITIFEKEGVSIDFLQELEKKLKTFSGKDEEKNIFLEQKISEIFKKSNSKNLELGKKINKKTGLNYSYREVLFTESEIGLNPQFSISDIENEIEKIGFYKNKKEEIKKENIFFIKKEKIEIFQETEIGYIAYKIIKNKLEKKGIKIIEKGIIGNNSEIPKKTFILKAYQKFLKNGEIKKSEILEKFLVRKKIRSLSGVLPVTLFTKPFPCPGKCIFCPDDVKMPKSYLSEETASQRALRQEFSAYDQIRDRIEAGKIMGHNTEKLEIIVLGGTFPFYPKDYQEEFVKEIFGAANGIEKSEVKNFSLEKLQEINEKTEHKIVGISVEIRPDSGTDEILSFLRYLGVTRVEMGVQSLNDEVILKNKRGCTNQDVIKTTKKLKEYGFKVMYHMMTGLYGSSKKIDKKSFYDLFHSPFYHPDQLKIYPCLLLKGTELEKKADELNYKPNSDEAIFEMIKYVKKECIPYHTRIGRITRDVPAQLISGGSKKSNIRENISDLVKKAGIECKCIRCREIKDEKFEDFEIFVEKIELNGGTDFYIEARTSDKKCLGLIRLFIPESTKNKNFGALENKGIIRELHVYGKIASISKNDKNKTQHKGLGEILIKESEKIVLEKFKNLNGIAIISAVGTRGYYAKFGYKLEETYMVKTF